MTVDDTSDDYVAERIRASELTVGDGSPVEAMLANSLREGKPLADDGKLHDTVQAAENAASNFVFVPPGTFNETVSIDTSGLTLIGAGDATVIDGGASHAIDINSTGVSDVTVKNLAAQTTGGGGNTVFTVVLGGSSAGSHLVENVTVLDSDRHGILCDADDCTMSNCHISKTDNSGIYVNGGLRATVKECIIGSDVGDSGIWIRNDDGIVSNCVITGVGTHGIATFSGPDTVLIGNRIHNVGADGISCDSADTIVANNRISGVDTANYVYIQTTATTVTDANVTGAAN